MRYDVIEFNRAAFLSGSLAALGVAVPQSVHAATAGPGTPPAESLAQLLAGNKRFVENDFPPLTSQAERREMLKDGQSPFAAVLSCCDSRVIPELAFVQGLGQLFVARVAGNYPDDLVIGSIEYAIENLGTRLVMVLGHQDCGAVKAVYSALERRMPLPSHLSSIERLVAPGIEHVVRARGSLRDAVNANVRAAVKTLKAAPPFLSTAVSGGHVDVVGAYYNLGSGRINLVH
jgi:carbonic anhydrase